MPNRQFSHSSKLLIEHTIGRLGLGQTVNLVGAVPHDLPPKYYQQADVMLFPSYAESFGIVQVESLACGTPVVAYANEGSNGIFGKSHPDLVGVGNKDGLEKQTLSMLVYSSPMNLLLKISQKYEILRMHNQYYKMYKKEI